MKENNIKLPYKFRTPLWFVSRYDDGVYRVDKTNDWCYVVYDNDVYIRMLYENYEYDLEVEVYDNYKAAKNYCDMLNESIGAK